LESSSDSDSDKSVADDDSDDLAPPVPFAGDAFGSAEDYAEENFGQYAEDDMEGVEAEPEVDEEEIEAAAAAAELEAGWEPFREGGATVAVAEPEEPTGIPSRPVSPEEPRGDTEDEEHTSQARQAAEERLESDPFVVRYSSRYPQSRCGAIKKSRQTIDEQYSSAVNKATNPWAPFASEVDWKVARWAKLRGAGSTAFSDLLAIDGVSPSNLLQLLTVTDLVLGM
jgi:hypothetical protein